MPSPSTTETKQDRAKRDWPALLTLGFATGNKTVPFVQQLEWTDCGAASLCMVMAYHGRITKLPEVREAMGIGRDGVSAKSILDTAERWLAGQEFELLSHERDLVTLDD